MALCARTEISTVQNLEQLASLVRQLNGVGRDISVMTDRPPLMGNVGEFIAANVFDIELHSAGNSAGSDGRFRSGPRQEASVNIKWYARLETLDINPKAVPDVYLVLAGPRATPSTKRHIRPWVIANVYFFDAPTLHAELHARGVKIQVGTSLLRTQWDAAEVYPAARNSLYSLSDVQRSALALFSHDAVGA
jgi:hypothetical protein